MDLDEQISVTVTDQGGRNAETLAAQCPLCSLKLPPGTTVCPNDGHKIVPEYEAGGSIAGKYQFIEPIGQGGMSAVYKALDPMLSRVVAIKVLHQHLANNEQSIKRFQQEGRAISQLNHPSIVHIYEFGVLDHGQPFIVMDYVPGESIHSLIKREGALSASKALRIFKQVTQALQHAHGRGVLHRDLKPSNVMIDFENGEPKVTLVDFGIAKVITSDEERSRLTATGEIFGSPLYMSPEQCSGQVMDVRSDLYSLGCLMYEVLTGKPVFKGENPLEVLFKQLNASPAPMAETNPTIQLPSGMEDVVAKLLEKQSDKRYQTADELQDALNRIDLSKVARQLRRRSKSFSTPKWAIPLGVAMTCTILGITVGVMLMQQNTSKTTPTPVPVPQTQPPAISTQVPASVKGRAQSITDARLKHDLPILADSESLKLTSSDLTDVGLAYIGRLTNIKTLELGNTRIQNLEPLHSLYQLETLNVESTKVNDESLKSIARLPLKTLNLCDTAITDKGIATIAPIRTLENLQLKSTKISDASGPNVHKLKNIETMDLSETSITSKFFDYLPDNLQWLDMRKTDLGDSWVKKLIRLKNLRGLYIDGNKLTDEGLNSLSNLNCLRELYCENPSITDAGLAYLSKLGARMTELELDGTNLTDACGDSLAKFKALESLELRRTHIGPQAVQKMSQGVIARYINFDGDKNLTDDAIPFLCKMQNLRQLVVSNTGITGAGALRFSGATNLESLDLQGVRMSDEQLKQLRMALPNCTIIVHEKDDNRPWNERQ